MPEYTITIKIKSGKRTEFECWPEYWSNKDIPVKGMELPLTVKNVGEYICEHLKERVKEKKEERNGHTS